MSNIHHIQHQQGILNQQQHELEQIEQLLSALGNGTLNVSLLHKMNFKALGYAAKALLAQGLAQSLKGSITIEIAKAIEEGTLSDSLLEKVLDAYVGKARGKSAPSRLPSAQNLAGAERDGVAKGGLGKSWQQFARFEQTVNQGRPEGGRATSLMQLLTQRRAAPFGSTTTQQPPTIKVQRETASGKAQAQNATQAILGAGSQALMDNLQANDLDSLFEALSSPLNRALAAKMLKLNRGSLVSKLLKLEMCKVGAGKGTLPLDAQAADILAQAGICSLATLAAVKNLKRKELQHFYDLLRRAGGLFGGRPLLKKDLKHWSERAARKRSSIILADPEEGELDPDDCQEHLQSWYAAQLYYEELEEYRRLQRLTQEQEERERRQREDEDQRGAWEEHIGPDEEQWHYDNDSPEGLICFWIDEPPLAAERLHHTRRRYVCIDPQSGVIIPQNIEANENEPTGAY